MPLPFLKPKQVAGVIISHRQPDGSKVEQTTEKDESISACAADLIRAVHAKDESAVAKALRDAFTILDSEEHEEGEHTNSNSYDEMNEKAAREAGE